MNSEFDNIKRFLSQFGEFTLEVIDSLGDVMKRETCHKRSLIAESGAVCNRLFFINKGIVRFFVVNSKGEDITTDIFFAPGFITSYSSFTTGVKSQVNIQAITDLDYYILSKDNLYDLYDSNPVFDRISRLIAEHFFRMSEIHLLSLLMDSPAERYQKLVEKSPEMVRFIPLKYIASYLGVTPESLSRIRSRLIS